MEKHAARLSADEAEAAGKALAHASARAALDTFGEWLRPKDAGFLGKLFKVLAGPPVQRVALAGLGAIAGKEAEELLELLAAHGEAALRPDAAAATRGAGKGAVPWMSPPPSISATS